MHGTKILHDEITQLKWHNGVKQYNEGLWLYLQYHTSHNEKYFSSLDEFILTAYTE